jgi:(p)ppGpp synthase/HD superfamily hydrolase
MGTRLTERFDEALAYASALHRTQKRKGGDIPYIGHLLSAAALVIEGGGTETQAIAALLHDAAEDQGGEPTLDEIRTRFGAEVADIVEECSDTMITPKPPWRQRKEDYIAELGKASDSTVLVSMADKLDNARTILRDLRRHGPPMWERFSTADPQDHLWYYKSLLEVYRRRSESWLVDELARVLQDLEHEIGPPVAATV